MVEQPILISTATRNSSAGFPSIVAAANRSKPADRRFEDYDLVLAAAQAGLGVALLRSPLADAALASGTLTVVSPRSIRNASAHYLVQVPSETHAPVLRVADAIVAMTSALRC